MEQYGMWIWIIIMIALFYFMLIRPQKKRERAERALRSSLQPGDKIVTIGGFTGRILSVKDDEVVFEAGSSKTKLTVKKWAIQSRTSPEQAKPAEETPAVEEKAAEKAAPAEEEKSSSEEKSEK